MKIAPEDRKLSLGGSDAGAVMGLNPYMSKFDAWCAKTGEAEDKFSESKYTYWGKVKEPVVLSHYAERHCVEIIESPKRCREERLWMSGTPDGLIVAPEDGRGDVERLGTYLDPVSGKRLLRRGVEAKTALAKHATKWHRAGAVSIGDAMPYVVEDFDNAKNSVPTSYWFQCQWYMELMDFDEWDLFVLLDSSDYREYRVLRDRNYMKRALSECERFWNYNVAKGIPPAADWGKMVNQVLARRFGEHSDAIRPASDMENTMAFDLRDLSTSILRLKDREAELRTELARKEGIYRAIKQNLDDAYKGEAELKSWFRERIGVDAGIKTKEGVLTWKTDKNGQRTFRKKWDAK